MSSQQSKSTLTNTSNYKGVIITKKDTFSSTESQSRLLDSNGRMKSLYHFNEPNQIGNYKDFMETKSGIYGSEAKIKEFLRGSDSNRDRFH